MPVGNPGNHLYVAQPARAFLDVGLQIVGSVMEFLVTAALFFAFYLEKITAVPDFGRVGALLHALVKLRRACQQARFHDVGDHGDVGQRLFNAVIDGAHAVTDFKTNIPEKSQQTGDLRVKLIIVVIGEQDEQINIRTWHQFAAAIAADSNQCQAVFRRSHKMGPGSLQHLVNQP